jgi:type VI secretion system protein ImpH
VDGEERAADAGLAGSPAQAARAAGEDRLDEARALVERLAPAARQGFVALVALLERLRPDAARVGGAGPPASEPLRFRHDPALTFHPGDISRLRVAPPPLDPFEAAARPALLELTTTFLGLTGTVSPMPTHLAEEVAAEDPDRPVQGAFLDLFHHRLLSLLYRLLVKYDQAREFLAGGTDEWSTRVLALAGVDVAMGAPELPRWRLLRLAPVLATRVRNADTLRLVVEDVLGEHLGAARVDIEEFVGAWVTIEPGERCRLGQANASLGRDLLLGQRVFDRAGKFRLSIGPLSNATFDRLRPEGDLHATLKKVVALASPDPLAYELELVLALEETPPFVLGARATTRLGQNTWLGARREEDARVVYDLDG